MVAKMADGKVDLSASSDAHLNKTSSSLTQEKDDSKITEAIELVPQSTQPWKLAFRALPILGDK